jgi:DNA-binding beta-propeller fold protein YncE
MPLLGLNKDPFGGYWPELYGSNGRLYVVASDRDLIQVMDVTDPANPLLVRDWVPEVNGEPFSLRNATYPKFQDNLFMADGLVVNMDRLIAGHPDPVELVLDPPESGPWDASQYSMPLGNLIVSGGYGADSGGLSIHVRQQAPDTTAPRVAFHVPEVNRTGYSRHMPISVLIHEELDSRTLHNGVNFMIREVVDGLPAGPPVDCIVNLGSENLLMLTPKSPLKADTTYQVDFPEVGGLMDISGNRIEPYSWRFSTGGALSVGSNAAPMIEGFVDNPRRWTPGQTAVFGAQISDEGALDYRFDPGDGSGFGPWVALAGNSGETSQAISLQHSYGSEGRYTAQLQVRDAQLALSTAAINLVVLSPVSGPRPTESSPIIAAADGTVWAVNPDADTVTAMDGQSGAKLGEYPVGDDPRGIAEDAAGRLWVSCMKSDELYLLDPSGAVLEVLALDYGDAPHSVVAAPDGGTIYVSAYGSGRLYQFDINARTSPGVALLGPTPKAIAVTADHSKVFVTRFISTEYYGQVWRVNPGDLSVRAIDIHLVTDVDGNNSSAGVPNYLAGIAISPRGNYAVVTGKKDNTFRGPIFGSDAPTHENLVRAMMATIDIENERLMADSYHDFDNSDSPTGLRFSPQGDLIFVAVQGNNEVFVIDGLDLGAARTATRIPLQQTTTNAFGEGGRAPQGLVLLPQTARLFSQNFMSRSATVFDASPALAGGEFRLPRIAEIPKVLIDGLAPDIRLGKEIFYNANDARMGAETYMSCATCHADGGHDGRVWDFSHAGEGLRRTTDLRGRGGMDHGAVHWSGNFDEIQDFEIVMRDRFLGEGFIADAVYGGDAGPHVELAGLSPELDALAAYVASLGDWSVPRSPHREPDTGAMTEAALRGRELFIDLNCMSCHDGQRLTDSAWGGLRDVGTLTELSGARLGTTLEGIDTPTLVGLHATERYGHLGLTEDLESFLLGAMGRYYEAEEADRMNGNLIEKRDRDGGGGSDFGWDIFGAHGNAIVNVGNSGSTIRFEGVDGGSGGPGQLWVRSAASKWASGSDYDVIARVNGVDVPVSFPRQLRVPDTRLVGLVWRHADIVLEPGSNNSIELRRGGGRNMPIDAIMVAHSDDLARASAHRAIPPGQMGDMIAFLKQLDGRPDNLPPNYAARSWQVRHFGGGASGPAPVDWTADPDEDGINNRLEFIQGFNPHVAEAAADRARIVFDEHSGAMQFRFSMREELGDAQAMVQHSYDLDEWTELDGATIEDLHSEAGVGQFGVPLEPGHEGARFFRILAP